MFESTIRVKTVHSPKAESEKLLTLVVDEEVRE